jgi:hypothetical protein
MQCEIASNSQNLHNAFMSEDEIGEIRDELKVYKEQLDSLREDLKIVVNSEQLRHAVLPVYRTSVAFDGA